MPTTSQPHRALSPFFGGSKASFPDIADLLKRKPNGLGAIYDFKEIHGDEKESVGLIGFSFGYGGLTYYIKFMTHDGGRDIEEITVSTPAESTFLRPPTDMGIAEKIYTLSVIQHLGKPERITTAFNRLQNACFNSDVGKFDLMQPARIASGSIAPVEPFAHIGLKFPSDADYQEMPDADLKAFEFWDNQFRYVIDFSNNPFTTFLVSDPKISLLQTTEMLQGMAVRFIQRLEDLSRTDFTLSRLLNEGDLIGTLRTQAKGLPMFIGGPAGLSII